VGDRYEVILTDGVDQMNLLLQTSNDIAAAHLQATQGLGSALGSRNFTGQQITTIQETLRATTGNRGLTIGGVEIVKSKRPRCPETDAHGAERVRGRIELNAPRARWF
jgi:hypothetical protein